ncbi:MAG: hypothetical protein JNJ83_20480 [Verrucomicrobiaceae bacterium]|nr:hypothetical protein [Verrucomicrobiaceae bacterium]
MTATSPEARHSSSPAPWLAAGAALVGLAASKSPVAKLAVLAAAGAAAYRFYGKKQAEPVEEAPQEIDLADSGPAEEPHQAELLPTEQLEAQMEPVAAAFVPFVAEVTPQEPQEASPAPIHFADIIQPLAPTPLDETFPIAPLPETTLALTEPVVEPTWALEMEPLPQIVDSITTQLDAKTMNATMFGLPPVEVEMPKTAPFEPAAYSPNAVGADIPDEVILTEEPSELRPVEPLFAQAAPLPPPQPPVEPVGNSFLASSDMAKLLQELAERIPPNKPIEPMALPTLHNLLVEPEPTPPVSLPEPVQSAPVSLPEPVNPIHLPTETPAPEHQLVSAVSLFAKLAQSPPQAEAPSIATTPVADEVQHETKPLPTGPGFKPRPLITVSKSTAAEPARKNWLTWWK